MPKRKSAWLVYSKLASDPPFRTVLGNCDLAHALSVQETLVYERAWPDDVFLVQVVSVDDLTPIGNEIPFTPKETYVG